MNIAEIKDRISTIADKKQHDLATIRERLADAREREHKAADAMAKAMEELDTAAYTKAVESRDAAQLEIKMLSEREVQLYNMRFVSEAESDSVIDDLLAHETALRTDFEAAIIEPLRTLAELCAVYGDAVTDTENTITAWTATVHPNYRSQFTTYADGSNRSPAPIPVHIVPYLGGDYFTSLDNMLNHFRALLKE